MIFSYLNSPLLMHQKCCFAVQPQTAAEGFCAVRYAVSFMDPLQHTAFNRILCRDLAAENGISPARAIIDLIYSVVVECSPKFHLPFLTLYTWLQGVSTI
jgi:hypothetical protein